jgi:hypothetical protein
MTTVACACGAVRLEAVAPSMMTVICHCTSCRTDGRAFDARSPVAPIVDEAEGTAVVLWRKDRVRCVVGGERLVAQRLAPDAPSRRMIASCCDTPMFGDFTKGFWVSIYRGRVTNAPTPSMRVMTSDAPDGTAFPDDGLPRFRGRSGQGGRGDAPSIYQLHQRARQMDGTSLAESVFLRRDGRESSCRGRQICEPEPRAGPFGVAPLGLAIVQRSRPCCGG